MAEEIVGYQTALQAFLYPVTPVAKFKAVSIAAIALHGILILINVSHISYELYLKRKRPTTLWLIRRSKAENGQTYYLMNAILLWPLLSLIYASLVIWSQSWALDNQRGSGSQMNFIATLVFPLLPLLLASWLMACTVIFTGVSILAEMPHQGKVRWRMTPWLYHTFSYFIGVCGILIAVVVGIVANAKWNNAVKEATNAYNMIASGQIDPAALGRSLTQWGELAAASAKIAAGCQHIGEVLLTLMAFFGIPAAFVLIASLRRAQRNRTQHMARSNMSAAEKAEKLSMSSFIFYAGYATFWTLMSVSYQYINEAWKQSNPISSADTSYIILNVVPLYLHGFSTVLVGVILFTRFTASERSISGNSNNSIASRSQHNTKIHNPNHSIVLHPIRVDVQTNVDLDDDMEKKSEPIITFTDRVHTAV